MKTRAAATLISTLFLAILTVNIAPTSAEPENQQPGWPIYTGYPGMTAPVLADFDQGYAGLEVIVMYPVIKIFPIDYSSRVYVWHQDGTPMNNWSPKILDEPVYTGSPPAVGDLDKDGRLDLVITTNTDDDGDPPKVHAFDYLGTPLPGWPQAIGGDMTSAPVFADLDKNGYLEVLVSSKDGNLYIWRYNGDVFNPPNWPKQTNEILYRSPAAVNLDRDAALEIVIGGGGPGVQAPFHVFIWNIDGTNLNPNWPKEIPDNYRAETPSFADIDRDGRLEIVMGVGYDTSHGRVYAWNPEDGSLVAGQWPKSTSGYPFWCPISNLDPHFPCVEIISSIRYDNKIYAWHSDGSEVSGWPYVLGGAGGSSPVIGDIDGDRQLEVVAGAYDGKVYAINHDGTDLPGWPKQTGYIIQVSPAIGDIDCDGKTEVFQPSADGYVYAWEVVSNLLVKPFMPWPMLQRDETHNGLYPYICPTPVLSVMSIEPAVIWDLCMVPGSLFVVFLTVDYVEDLWSYQFELGEPENGIAGWDPAVLNLVAIENGPFLGSQGGNVQWFPGDIDNTEGTLTLSVGVLDPPGRYPTGGGVLAILTFKVVGYGTSCIHLGNDTGMMDPYGSWIVHGTTNPERIRDGFFSNVKGPELYIRTHGAQGWPEWHVNLLGVPQTLYAGITNHGDQGANIKVRFTVINPMGVTLYLSDEAWVGPYNHETEEHGVATVSATFTPPAPGKYYVGGMLYFKVEGMGDYASYQLVIEGGGEGVAIWRDISTCFKVVTQI